MAGVSMAVNLNDADCITHAGSFHADDVMAVAILACMFQNGLRVYRANQLPENIDPKVIVFDIGGGKFDHHQKGGNGCREDGTPYAAAGLIWKAYGTKICEQYGYQNPDIVAARVDNMILRNIDAYDCGYIGRKSSDVSSAISAFNPPWNSNLSVETEFLRAVEFAQDVLENAIRSANASSEAVSLVDTAIETSDGKIMILNYSLPWTGTLLNSQNEKAQSMLFVVYPCRRGGYNVRAVPDKLGSKTTKKSFPEDWRGLKGDELRHKTGVASATFVHPAGFVAGAETIDDAVMLARLVMAS